MKSSLDEIAERAARDFQQNGYAVIENCLSQSDIANMKSECLTLIDESAKENKTNIFGNDFNVKNKYFLDSANRIGYFYEKFAINLETGEFLLPRERSMAKIGHALHCLNPTFKKYTTSDTIIKLFRKIGFDEPNVVQSMIIFKNPKVGGAYTPHQDASFLCSEPIRLAGMWYAMDDATVENGCLEFIPGSHHWPLKRRFVRNFDCDQDGGDFIKFDAPEIECQDDQFVSVPVSKGSLVMIHGLVVHRSGPNKSEEPRWVYTFHAYDRANSVYLKDNWLKETETFMPIYSNNGL